MAENFNNSTQDIAIHIQRTGERTQTTIAGEASALRANVDELKSKHEGTEVTVSSRAPVAILRTIPGPISKLGSSGILDKAYPTEAPPPAYSRISPILTRSASFVMNNLPFKETAAVLAVGLAAAILPTWEAMGVAALAAGVHYVAKIIHDTMRDNFDQAGNDAALEIHLTVRSLQNQVRSLQIHKELKEMDLKIEEEKTKRAKIEEEEKTKREEEKTKRAKIEEEEKTKREEEKTKIEEEKTKRAKIEEEEKTKRARIELEARKLESSCCQSVSRMSPRPRKSF